jgi:hypothetical protein
LWFTKRAVEKHGRESLRGREAAPSARFQAQKVHVPGEKRKVMRTLSLLETATLWAFEQEEGAEESREEKRKRAKYRGRKMGSAGPSVGL